jgi:hypothetical protein
MSKLQPTVAISTAEAEYMAACTATQEALHLRQLLEDVGYMQNGATTIFEDNQSCIALGKNPVLHKRTKHVAIKYHFIREKIAEGTINLEYMPTEHQLADMLTKGLPKHRLTIIRTKAMGGHYCRQLDQ